MQTTQITVANIQLTTNDNIEFYGEHKNKQFKITKDLDVNSQEFLFSLDIKSKEYPQSYQLKGTFNSLAECLSNI